MHRRLPSLFLLAIASGAATAILWACSSDEVSPPPEPDAGNPVRAPFDSGSGADAPSDAPADAGPTFHARAAIAATSLADAGATTGSITFDEASGGVHVTITITGATAGMHGVQIRDGTSCADTSVDGSVTAAGAAGAPWNPNDAGVVDLGNVTIATDGSGTSSLDSTAFDVRPDGGASSAIGHAVVVRQGANNSGAAAGCGIIQPQ